MFTLRSCENSSKRDPYFSLRGRCNLVLPTSSIFSRSVAFLCCKGSKHRHAGQLCGIQSHWYGAPAILSTTPSSHWCQGCYLCTETMRNKEQSSTRHEAAAHPFLSARTCGRRKLNSLKSYIFCPVHFW